MRHSFRRRTSHLCQRLSLIISVRSGLRWNCFRRMAQRFHEQVLPSSSPLPFYAYPFLVFTFVGWLGHLLKAD